MKFVIEVLLAVFLHPIAVVLVWISLLRRRDIGSVKKVLWAVVATVWGIGPILYMLLGDGELW